MDVPATVRAGLGWAAVVTGILLLLSAWTIPFVVELAFGSVVLYAGLVLAGTVRGRRPASAIALMVCLVLVLMLPARDAAWSFVDRALHAGRGLVLVALGLAKAVTPGARRPRGLFYGEAR